MPQNTAADQVGEYAKNALYMTIGLGVLAIQQVQVQRRQLVDWLSGQATELRGSLETMQSRIEETVKSAEERVTAFEARRGAADRGPGPPARVGQGSGRAVHRLCHPGPGQGARPRRIHPDQTGEAGEDDRHDQGRLNPSSSHQR